MVKNFLDAQIDSFIESNNMKNILTEAVPVGSKLALGIKESSGEIICFLEDDDLFLPKKISKVRTLFAEDPNLVYYHNVGQIILQDGTRLPQYAQKVLETPMILDDEDKILNEAKKLLQNDIAGNVGCMAIKKSAIKDKLSSLKKIERAPDRFVFYACLQPNKRFRIDGDVLTLIRRHAESASKSVGPFLTASRKRNEFSRLAAADRKYIYESISHPVIKANFWNINLWSMIDSTIRNIPSNRRKLLSLGKEYLRNSFMRYRRLPPFFALIFVLYLIFPAFSRISYTLFEWTRSEREWNKNMSLSMGENQLQNVDFVQGEE